MQLFRYIWNNCYCAINCHLIFSKVNLRWNLHYQYFALFIHLFIGFEKVVQMLIEKGANVNAVDQKNNYSALFYAARNGNILNTHIFKKFNFHFITFPNFSSRLQILGNLSIKLMSQDTRVLSNCSLKKAVK